MRLHLQKVLTSADDQALSCVDPQKVFPFDFPAAGKANQANAGIRGGFFFFPA
jgi:hypothetical protein